MALFVALSFLQWLLQRQRRRGGLAKLGARPQGVVYLVGRATGRLDTLPAIAERSHVRGPTPIIVNDVVVRVRDKRPVRSPGHFILLLSLSLSLSRICDRLLIGPALLGGAVLVPTSNYLNQEVS